MLFRVRFPSWHLPLVALVAVLGILSSCQSQLALERSVPFIIPFGLWRWGLGLRRVPADSCGRYGSL